MLENMPPLCIFFTMRKMRSTFSNAYHSSAEGYCAATVMVKDSRSFLLSECPTYGPWFEAFVRGCHKRMRDIIYPDRVVFFETMHHLLKLAEDDWEHAAPQARFIYERKTVFIL
jgi:hypothetical protein